jgi:hypothetical protein
VSGRPSDILRENLAAIRARHPELAAALEAPAEPPEGFAARTGRGGRPTAAVDGLLLHSAYDPIREARSLLAGEFPSPPAACVFLGYGLGYLPREFVSLWPDADCIVVEPDLSLFEAGLALAPLGPLGESGRVSWVLGAGIEGSVSALQDLLETLGPRAAKALRLGGLAGRYEGFFREAERAIERYNGKSSINRNTLKRFGRLWVRNLARNFREIGAHPGIAGAEGLLGGFPALVVAAGPSLDAALPSLPALAERMAVVCVDTALGQVRRAGVDPDFVVVVDPQYWNTRHLDRLATARGYLVTESAAHPSVFRLPCAGKLLAASLFPLGARLEGEGLGKLGAGGSVATSAWDLVRFLGASPVAILGMDLGFPGNATHARGSFFEERAILRGERRSPAEKAMFLSLHDAAPYPVPSNEGGAVLTDKRMILYAWWFESRMRRYPGTPTFNLSPGGVRIRGMPPASLDRFLALPRRRSEIDGALEALGRLAAANREAFAEARGSLLRELAQMERLACEALAAAGEAREALAAGRYPSAELEALDRIEARMLASEAKEVVSFILPAPEELVSREAKDLAEALRHSQSVYGEAAESAAFHARLLARAAGTESSGPANGAYTNSVPK